MNPETAGGGEWPKRPTAHLNLFEEEANHEDEEKWSKRRLSMQVYEAELAKAKERKYKSEKENAWATKIQ